MSYKYSSGNHQIIGDLSGSDDSNRDTGIDFGEDRIDFQTSGSVSFSITPTGSSFETPIQIGGQTIVSTEGNITCGAVDAGEVSASAFVVIDEGTPVYTLPLADGTNGQAIVTDGNGELSFSTISGGGGGGSTSPAGSNTQIQYNNNNSFGATGSLTYDGTRLKVDGNIQLDGELIHSSYAKTSYPSNMTNTGSYAAQKSFIKELFYSKYDWPSTDTALFSIEPYDERTGQPYNGNDLVTPVGIEITANGHWRGAGNVFIKIMGAMSWVGGPATRTFSYHNYINAFNNDPRTWFNAATTGTNGIKLNFRYNHSTPAAVMINLKVYAGYGTDNGSDGKYIYWVFTEHFNEPSE